MNMEWGLKSWLVRAIFHYLRLWDLQAVNRVDKIIANSNFIARRIEKIYRRPAQVIYPPIDIARFSLSHTRQDYYLVVSRLVQYKKVDVIVKAFAQMPDKKLVVIGGGPDLKKIEAERTANITLLGYQPIEVVVQKMQAARALIMASQEDFGIVPVEAQACGTPVIAFGRGGARETVLDLSSEKPTGLFFEEQTPEAICRAVARFDEKRAIFTPENCRQNASRFSNDLFLEQFSTAVEKAWQDFRTKQF